jgi:hypothetical protein
MTRAQKEQMYRNMSTAPAFIRVRARDLHAGSIKTLILENADFARFQASERGVAKAHAQDFYARDYVEWMLEHGDEPLDLDLRKLESFMARTRFGSMEAAHRYLQSRTVERPLTLKDLGVQSPDALLEKYFAFDARTGVGTLKPGVPHGNDPGLVALLIDLGYVVTRGDIAPVLRIQMPATHS